jgi:hypothetical protein
MENKIEIPEDIQKNYEAKSGSVYYNEDNLLVIRVVLIRKPETEKNRHEQD